MAPTAIITINLCDCSGHGDCLFGELADGQTSGSNFRIVGCKCNTGYSGSNCADDFDGCQDNPCRKHTNCTDLTPAEHVAQKKAYTCSECPKGFYADDGETCIDINECDSTPCDSHGTCVNTPGTFRCDCEDGYTQTSPTTCKDIDECTEKSSGCEQICNNNDGSFACSCNGGYTLNDDHVTCKQG
ncbi:hypothetical protein NP493_1797g00012 [Ridgeia piscesae]|uniref:EGF-like domain-containing protein n=1 Tax=Ridgeia piscesae TaxID=27915 RepID=A0AAD9JUF3_RIDPI|nr:hypothetical protein NP493_1797g00012 [Ridgeia piscesae]